MVELAPSSVILWDTLKLSAEPLRGRCDILVVARVKVQTSGRKGFDEYRINFELNRHHGLVSYDTEVLTPAAGADEPLWRYSGRRDLVVAVKNRFLATQLYAHVAGQLGWMPEQRTDLIQAPLDP
ncbi:hypothetical protein KBI52_11900 [Microvirga sp. HBU67558]|uniref:hypothetical protein n=1 Tax=Microvirga TaxID=186650 RepID=UPI001B385EEF|nr:MULTISPECIES: hypothetical protein [unclassified Microvirga]MBQ0820910.1 hypothetical protein [Microvirga sp. HBU67558]